jgi:hypothetical protein
MRAPFQFIRSISGILPLGIALAACHGGGGVAPSGVVAIPAPIPAADSCVLAPPSAESPKTLQILVTDGFSPGRPGDARTRGERVIARQLYETLIRLTCDGQVEPGLAESWTSADSGRIWIFQIRRTSRFWDGTPVMASQVLATWAGGRTADAQVPWAGIDHTRIVDEKRVAVYFNTITPDVPRVLADPRLAITLSIRNQSRPQGSGWYRLSYEDSVSLVADAWDSGVPRPRDLPGSLEFHAASGKAARDLLDGGIDLLVTDDRSLLDYATARSQHTIVPLPWDRAYVLFVPATATSTAPTAGPAAGFLDPIAREAVGVDARVATISSGWQPDSCGSVLGREPDERRQPRRVVYPSADETARELAHRLVTFAGVPGQGGEWLAAAFRSPVGPGRSFPLAIGLEPGAWPAALERGDELAYVFALPVRGFGKCSLPARTTGSWIALVETRAHLAIRAGVGNVSVSWDGTPFIGKSR